MKTHMSNTQSFKLKNDVVGHQNFLNHQRTLHSNIKPAIDNKRKSQVKIVKNSKKQLNQNPQQHVNQLYGALYSKNYKSTIDNKAIGYDQNKQLLADKVKKNKYERYADDEHKRQVRSMQNRVQNCKNMQQRKKDNTDPLVNPAYFIKHGQDAPAVTIDSYCKKIVAMNRPQSAVQGASKTMQKDFGSMMGQQPQNSQPTAQYFGKVPSMAVRRPNSANPHGRHSAVDQGLPECTFKSILDHIVNKKLFRDVEMKVLYVRLCHVYGQEEVGQVWENLMDELQR